MQVEEVSPGDYDERWAPEPDAEALMAAALLWLRQTARLNTLGLPSCRFRVRLYGPKGMSVIDGGHFACHDTRAELQDGELPPLPNLPAPREDLLAEAASLPATALLGEFYNEWARIVLGSVGQLQGINNQMLGRLHTELQQSRGQVDQLVASILDNQIKELEVAREQAGAEREGDARRELAREAIGQLGQAASAFLTSKGLSPDMVDLFGVLGSSPELMATLKKPGVRALMSDPDNLKGLAAMLAQAADAAQAQAAPSAPPQHTPTPPTTHEGSTP